MQANDKKIEIAEEYIRIMSMLVPPGKMGLEFVEHGEREDEIRAQQHLISVAKQFKLHRKIKSMQCGIMVTFAKNMDDLSNQILYIDLNSSTIEGHLRRMLILATLFIIVTFIFLRMRY